MVKKKQKKKIKRAKPTPQQIEQRAHRRDIRSVFKNIGFQKVNSVSDKEFTYKKYTSDFDDVFVYKNIIVFAEYTLMKSGSLSSHIKPKKLLYDKILNNKVDFIEHYERQFSTFKEARDNYFDSAQCKIIILYCSRNSISAELKAQIQNVIFLDYPILRYFKSVSNSIKLSARFEFFSFLKLNSNDIGDFKPAKDDFSGSILPESHSNYKRGYKVVSFYIDPDTLLSRSYVLRNDGWKDVSGLY